MFSVFSRRAVVVAALACCFIPARGVAADGPQNHAQVVLANTLKSRLQRPLNALYMDALRQCSGSSDEANLVREIGRLCGAAYAFGLIVIDDRHYLNDRRFASHVDRAFDEVRRATASVEGATKQVVDLVWKPLRPHWDTYKARYAALAQLWASTNKLTAKLQEVVLNATRTKTLVDRPIPLTVSLRYSDGRTSPLGESKIAWLVKPDNGEATIDSSRNFVAKEPGVYLVMAVHDELQSSPMVLRVARPKRVLVPQDLTEIVIGERDRQPDVVSTAACKHPQQAFQSLKIRVLEGTAHVGDIRITFVDGTTATFWENKIHKLAKGEHLVTRFEKPRKIKQFDLRSHGSDGEASRQVLVGLQWREGGKASPPPPPARPEETAPSARVTRRS